MNRKSFRVVRAGERTNANGKPVANKVLLATPDNEYQLMRRDLTYVDLPDRLSLHEPTQNIEFVYFPNKGMVSQVVVTKDGHNNLRNHSFVREIDELDVLSRFIKEWFL